MLMNSICDAVAVPAARNSPKASLTAARSSPTSERKRPSIGIRWFISVHTTTPTRYHTPRVLARWVMGWYIASGGVCGMIVSFRDDWLHKFFVNDVRSKKIPADLEDRLFRKLQMIDDATTDRDLR